ncbi:MAG: hypothetical protein WCG77_05010, partial [Actinomycetes bacterium]
RIGLVTIVRVVQGSLGSARVMIARARRESLGSALVTIVRVRIGLVTIVRAMISALVAEASRIEVLPIHILRTM